MGLLNRRWQGDAAEAAKATEAKSGKAAKAGKEEAGKESKPAKPAKQADGPPAAKRPKEIAAAGAPEAKHPKKAAAEAAQGATPKEPKKPKKPKPEKKHEPKVANATRAARQRQKAKTRKEKQAKKLSAHVKDPEAAAEYLQTWEAAQKGGKAKAGWRFNKATQAWLIRHCYENDKVSKDVFKVLMKYLGGLQGVAKDRMRTDAKAIALLRGAPLAAPQEEKTSKGDKRQQKIEARRAADKKARKEYSKLQMGMPAPGEDAEVPEGFDEALEKEKPEELDEEAKALLRTVEKAEEKMDDEEKAAEEEKTRKTRLKRAEKVLEILGDDEEEEGAKEEGDAEAEEDGDAEAEEEDDDSDFGAEGE